MGRLRRYWNVYNDFCNRMWGKLLCKLNFHDWEQTTARCLCSSHAMCDVKTFCGAEDVAGLLP